MTAVERHKYATLDAMRGVAALMVMLYHYFYLVFAWMVPAGVRHSLFASGYLAVDLFFVLSGFVIAHAYDDPLRAGMAVFEFARLRLIRVLPMIWVGIGLGTVLALIDTPGSSMRIASSTVLNALLMPGVPGSAHEAFAVDPPEWSLFFEIIANLLFAFAFFRLSRTVTASLMGIGLTGIGAVAMLSGTIADAGFSYSSFWGGFARVLFSFLCGVTLLRTRPRWAGRLPHVPAWALLVLTAVILAIPAPGGHRAAWDVAVVAGFAPLLVALASVSEPARSHRPWAALLALISYPTYAIHWPIMTLTELLLPRLHHANRLFVMAMLGVTLALSYLLARYYDAPVRHRLRRLWS